jgi:hypothetical protein
MKATTGCTKRTGINKTRLSDRNVSRKGFGKFSTASRADDGGFVVFQYPSGARYKVPVEYIRTWFPVGEKTEWTATILRVRTISDGDLVRIYFSDQRKADVVWDTVLMACEPLYEHYGGLTEHSKRLAEAWSKRNGTFRVDGL